MIYIYIYIFFLNLANASYIDILTLQGLCVVGHGFAIPPHIKAAVCCVTMPGVPTFIALRLQQAICLFDQYRKKYIVLFLHELLGLVWECITPFSTGTVPLVKDPSPGLDCAEPTCRVMPGLTNSGGDYCFKKWISIPKSWRQ